LLDKNKELLFILDNDGVQHIGEYDYATNNLKEKALCGKRLKSFWVKKLDNFEIDKSICEKCKKIKENHIKISCVKGLIIKEPWIDKILRGEKVWEIRGSNTSIRGRVALIKSGTGKIYGTVEVVDSIKLSDEDYLKNNDKHCIPLNTYITTPYPKTYAWVLSNPIIFKKPISYNHPQGAVIWVNLPHDILE